MAWRCWLILAGILATTTAESVADAPSLNRVVSYSFEANEDLDYDDLPDDWTRRRGPEFPHYVPIEIDPKSPAVEGTRSLCIESNGGRAILYSPPQKIDARHTYVFNGFIRTEQLKNDAALISVSFLNHKRQRVQRWLGPAVSGTHADWVPIQLGPLEPNEDVRFVVFGCHLVTSQQVDLGGKAWFDDLSLVQRPRLTFRDDALTHLVGRDRPVRLTTSISGLDELPSRIIPNIAGLSLMPFAWLKQPAEYTLDLSLMDRSGQVLRSHQIELPTDPPDDVETSDWLPDHTWTIDPPDYGYYRIRAVLKSNQTPLADFETVLLVLDWAEPSPQTEFGWSLAEAIPEQRMNDILFLAKQGGIHWLKVPLWSMAYSGGARGNAKLTNFLTDLNANRITPVGILSDPPPDLARKFDGNWAGVSDLFRLKPSVWWPYLEPVAARYSTIIRNWQLGTDRDTSFQGLSNLTETTNTVRKQFRELSGGVQIGIPWDAVTPPPSTQLPGVFFALGNLERSQRGQPDNQPALDWAEQSRSTRNPRWLTLRPLSASSATIDERAADLVRQMVAAKIAGADRIFFGETVDESDGLLTPDGSPTQLFLPWRTAAIALQGATYLGSLQMPYGSKNHVFEHPQGDVVCVIWNEEPVIEEFYLGDPSQVVATTVWGEPKDIPSDPQSNRQQLAIGPMPLIVRGCSAPITKWRLAIQFAKGRLPSETGIHEDAIIGRNPFPQGVRGTVTVSGPSEWEIEPGTIPFQLGAGESFRKSMLVTLPLLVTLGPQWTALDFELEADRLYQFRVYRPYTIGLGDIEIRVTDRKLANGTLEVELELINNIKPEAELDFECSLFVPGMKRERVLMTKLGQGTGTKLFTIPNANRYFGKEFWIRAEQLDGRRVLNYRWRIGREW
ncbi:hypothetical protein [Thalassoroseus pseudoceratinae]|uniref:hypothetical protein n=1 Tax=Thalassoroseus pseudoceratinae TaxID=2713176 RepID=UPI001421DF92|nr:hypothetical protein [Thalassoroseus pseudoceratinae]